MLQFFEVTLSSVCHLFLVAEVGVPDPLLGSHYIAASLERSTRLQPPLSVLVCDVDIAMGTYMYGILDPAHAVTFVRNI